MSRNRVQNPNLKAEALEIIGKESSSWCHILLRHIFRLAHSCKYMHAVYYPDRLVRFTHTCAHIPHYRPGLGLSSILLTLLLKKMHDKNPRSSIYRVLLQLSSRTVLPQTFPFFFSLVCCALSFNVRFHRVQGARFSCTFLHPSVDSALWSQFTLISTANHNPLPPLLLWFDHLFSILFIYIRALFVSYSMIFFPALILNPFAITA